MCMAARKPIMSSCRAKQTMMSDFADLSGLLDEVLPDFHEASKGEASSRA